MVAAKTILPVLGVPIPATMLNGVDALLSIVQMPKGVPVGTMAIGEPGAANAALLAAAILSHQHPAIRERLRAWRAARTTEVMNHTDLSGNG
jgi:5-(carboxyamino)imidazole ribonucleotide mutase